MYQKIKSSGLIKKHLIIITASLAVFIFSGCSKNGSVQTGQNQASGEVAGAEVSQEKQDVATTDVNQNNLVKIDTTAVISDNASTKKATTQDNTKKKDKQTSSKDNNKVDNTNSQSSPTKPTPCFDIKSDFKYQDNIYYAGKGITLDASCSKDAKDYQWYFNGKSLGSGEIFKNLPSRATSPDSNYEIKLIVNSSDGLTNSISKTVKFRAIPQPTICFNQDSAKVKSFILGQSYNFDASCSTFSDENPIVKYSWKFWDGGLNDAIAQDGVKVDHTFTKRSTNFEGGGCSIGGVQAELDTVTKLGDAYSNLHTYCISNN